MTLRDLLERVERATEGSRDLDDAIDALLFPTEPGRTFDGVTPIPDGWGSGFGPAYSASVDAALALIGRVLPGGWVGFQANRVTDPQRAWSAWLEVFPDKAKDYDTFERQAPTPALALCAALLAAMIEQETTNG